MKAVAPDYEREFDNRALAPDLPAILAGWRSEAQTFRERHRDSDFGVPYGDSERQRMDIFWPQGNRRAPMILFIHGGNWQMMDRSVFSHLAAGPLAHGFAVAFPSYDLCPAVTLSTIVSQIKRAAMRLLAEGNPPALVIGHSAGAQLAAMLIASPTQYATRGLLISGIFDLRPLLKTSINEAIGLDETDAARLSPLLLPIGPEMRIHVVAGAEENPEFLRQSAALASAWNGTMEILAGLNHFSILSELADDRSPLTRRACTMIADEAARQ